MSCTYRSLACWQVAEFASSAASRRNREVPSVRITAAHYRPYARDGGETVRETVDFRRVPRIKTPSHGYSGLGQAAIRLFYRRA